MLSFIQIIQTTCMLMYYTLQFFSVPKCFFLSRRNFKGQQTLRNVDQSLHFLYFEFENSAKSYAIQLHFVVECQVLSLIYCIIMFFFYFCRHRNLLQRHIMNITPVLVAALTVVFILSQPGEGFIREGRTLHMRGKGELFRPSYCKRGQVPPKKRDFLDGYLFQLIRGESCRAKLVKKLYNNVTLIFDSCWLYSQLQLIIADTVGTSSQCPHQRESVIAGVYVCQISVIYFCLEFSCCPYIIGVSTRSEMTVVYQLQLKISLNPSSNMKA